MANGKNSSVKATTAAAETAVDGNERMPDFSKWTPLQIGFAPYWNPARGKSFFGELVARDERDPAFVRYLVRNLKGAERCRRGPANDDTEEGVTGEEIVVSKGETFTISVYFALANEFDMLLQFGQDTGVPVPIYVEAVKTVKTRSGQDCWQWKAVSDPTHAAKLGQFRAKHTALMNAGNAAPGGDRQLEV